MNYESLGLRLDIDPENKEIEFRELFGITEERAAILDKKVLMAKSMIAIEGDVAAGIDYFLSECKHPNESHYAWLRLGQKCNCAGMAKVNVLGSSSGLGNFLNFILDEAMKDMPRRKGPGDLGEPLG
jgi:hypothetical protein